MPRDGAGGSPPWVPPACGDIELFPPRGGDQRAGSTCRGLSRGLRALAYPYHDAPNLIVLFLSYNKFNCQQIRLAQQSRIFVNLRLILMIFQPLLFHITQDLHIIFTSKRGSAAFNPRRYFCLHLVPLHVPPKLLVSPAHSTGLLAFFY